MPQITNRRLVNEMTATPVGKGTVYSAMLKSCAVNRERVARVNDSEKQRLEKVTKVLDKDGRYHRWRSDMEMEKTRESLRRLEAFQRVLREEFPARKFARQKGGNQETIYDNFDNFQDGGSHEQNSRVVKNKNRPAERRLWCAKPNTSQGKQLGNYKRSSENNFNESKTSEENENRGRKSFLRVRFLEDVLEETDDRIILSVSNRNLEENDRVEAKDKKDVDSNQKLKAGKNISSNAQIVTTVNKPVNDTNTIGASNTNRNHARNEELSLPETERKGFQSSEKKVNTSVMQPTISSSKRKSERPTTPSKINQNKLEPKLNSKQPDSEENIQNQQSIDKTKNQKKIFEPIGAYESIDFLALPASKRKEILRKRQERKERVMARIYTGGFDMKTLRSEIDRNLKIVDPERHRRLERKKLLAESKDMVERLVKRNKMKFDKEVMAPKPKMETVEESQHTNESTRGDEKPEAEDESSITLEGTTDENKNLSEATGAATEKREDNLSTIQDSLQSTYPTVTKVLDKDGRYHRWRSDMEMEKTRESLRRLEAFQRVLRKEFPARKFARQKGGNQETSVSNLT